MAIAVTNIEHKIENDRKVVYCDIDDTSYPTGGTVYTEANFGLAVVEEIIFMEPTDTQKMRRHDKTNKKLLAYNMSDGAQVTNATDSGAGRAKVIGH